MLKQAYKPVNGIGVLCGKDSDLTVIDYDTYQDDEKFDRERFETLFDNSTYTVNTLNKGKHYYFEYNKDIKQTQGKVLDIRSDNGFVVSPPTTFGDKGYEEILHGRPKTIRPVTICPDNTHERAQEKRSLLE